MLYSFNPEMLQNERAKAKAQKYGDVPYVADADPDAESSLGHHHHHAAEEEFIPPSHQEAAHIAPPDDEEANFRRPNPNDMMNDDDMETSLSLQWSGQPQHQPAEPEEMAPPPPSEPIPDDILEKHRSLGRVVPKLQLSSRGNHLMAAGAGHMNVNSDSVSAGDDAPVNRRATYHAGMQPPQSSVQQVELQSYQPVRPRPLSVQPANMERVTTLSHVDDAMAGAGDEEDLPTPVSEDKDKDTVLEMLSAAVAGPAAPAIEQKYTDKKKNIRSLKMKNVHSLSSRSELQNHNNMHHDDEHAIQDPALQMISQAMGVLVDRAENSNEDRDQHQFEVAAADAESDENEVQIPIIHADNGDGDGGEGEGGDESESDTAAMNKLIANAEHEDRKPANQLSETDPFGDIGSIDFANMAPKTEATHQVMQVGQEHSQLAQIQKHDPAFRSLDIGGGAVLFSGLGASHAQSQPPTEPEPQLNSSQPAPAALGFVDELMSANPEFGDNEPQLQPSQTEPQPQNEPAPSGLGFVDELMSANPEFGNNENIFGGGPDGDRDHVDALIQAAGPASHIVDFEKFAHVAEVEKIDYSKLTKVEDADQFKVMSVQETVVVDDGDGNVQQSMYQQIGNGNAPRDALDSILSNNMHDPAHNVHVLMEESQQQQSQQQPQDMLNAASPLDDIMAHAQQRPQQQQHDLHEEVANEPQQMLSPLEAMMAQAAEHSSPEQQTVPYENKQLASPLDALMAHSAPPPQSDDDDSTDDDDDEQRNMNDNANRIASPLDALMAAAESKEPVESETDHNLVASPLDAIMSGAASSPSQVQSEEQTDAPIVQQANSNDDVDAVAVVMPPDANDYDAELKEQEQNVADDNESVASEIIHGSPRHSEKREKLDPTLFGNTDDTSSSSSDDDEENSVGTDPNVY